MITLCIAIVQTPGSIVTDKQLRNCFDNNSDGCGFAYVQEDHVGHRKLKIFKTMDFDTFLRKYKRALSNNLDSPFLIHFRIATHGTVDTFNCHPFFINKNVAFIHNGIISGIGTDKLMSDTQLFNEKVLKKLPKDFYKHESYKLLIEKFIVGSKLMTLDIDGHVTIFNEASGHWKEGVWFSNHSYSYARTPVIYGGAWAGSKWYQPTKTEKKRSKVYEYFYCDGCNIRHNANDCHYFFTNGEAKVYCDDCKEVAVATEMVNNDQKISKHRYEIELAHEEYFGSSERYCR